MASTARFDVVAIGNAIVDVIARADDALIESEGLVKGSMRLIDAAEATRLYAAMGPAVEMSGGSAANTLAGMAALGRRCGFIGQVAKDQLGQVFTHDLTSLGVAFDTPAAAGGEPTARCLILVTPDGQRTMNTFLGASQNLGRESLDAALIAEADILYLEGYLWNADASRAAMAEAIALARAAGRRVAFTLSDTFVVAGHREDFRRMTAAREIDILFANEAELLELAQEGDFETALGKVAAEVPLLVATRGEKGAVALAGGERTEVAAEPIDTVVDTTGAGDLFAAGFLAGLADGRSMAECLTMGAVCAREIIAQVGPRAQTDLKAKVAERLG
ncbi:adenosine kinase [Sphingopyxis sp. YF1]|jgi:sugar/nucleoside kinase (ribokinase family)|uniref:adenosine kinase n=1 Tax=Sphingopyxis sp. YF1 TaxID=2482763 RepID=UPI001F620A45|nr:adenosine kinase [Sphingopyxis sp. YF1]UNU44404.1 adenosine kinase [Sphingopyxis sp. YF1]